MAPITDIEHETPTAGPVTKDGRRFRLIDHYRVPLEGGRLLIRNSSQSAILRGRLVQDVLPRLLPLLDGVRTIDEIAAELEGLLTLPQLKQIVEFIERKGLVRESEEIPEQLDGGELAAYESLSRFLGRQGSPYAALAALRTAHIGIIGSGPVVPALTAALAHVGVRQMTVVAPEELDGLEVQQSRYYEAADAGRPRSEVLRERVLSASHQVRLNVETTLPRDVSGWEEVLRGTSMLVVLLQGPILFHPWLEMLNTAALSLRVPWTSVALLDGNGVHVGPTIRPGVTACYKCFEQRFKSNLVCIDAENAFEAYVHDRMTRIDFGFLPPVAEIVAGFAAIEVVRTLSPDTVAQTSGRLMVFSIDDFTATYHPVLKLPRCPACSPVRDQPRPRVWS
ncbi:MAG: TOMM precursor leader peptide-binding protein [Bryobacteraceae bacterium]